MQSDLEHQLVERYPTIFRCTVTRSRERGYLVFGICCGDGWYALLDRMCAAIIQQPGHESFQATQVKEKFGGLRFYYMGGTDTISQIVQKAEEASMKTCENCGVTSGVTCGGRRWVRTLCTVCRPIFDGEPDDK